MFNGYSTSVQFIPDFTQSTSTYVLIMHTSFLREWQVKVSLCNERNFKKL